MQNPVEPEQEKYPETHPSPPKKAEAGQVPDMLGQHARRLRKHEGGRIEVPCSGELFCSGKPPNQMPRTIVRLLSCLSELNSSQFAESNTTVVSHFNRPRLVSDKSDREDFFDLKRKNIQSIY